MIHSMDMEIRKLWKTRERTGRIMDENIEQRMEKPQKKRRKFRIPMFSAIVLIILVCTILGIGGGEKNPLFDKGIETTLYAQTELGQEPELDARDFWLDASFDYDKVTFDKRGCDWNVEGTYEVPVLYDGKETNCVVQVDVGNPEESAPGFADDDAVFVNPEQ